jgi:hypothetical protein
MKLKTLFLVPMVAAVVIYAGLKGYIYFKVKGNLDELARMAAPFATLSYGGIGSDLRGKVSVENVKVTPVGTTVDFNVGEILVEGPDLEFLLAMSGGFKDAEPPRYAYLRFKRAEIPAGEDVMSQLNQISGLSASQAKGYMPEVCSLGGIFQHVGMDNIGYGKLIADFSMGYKLYQQSGEMEISTDYSVEGLEAFEMEMMLKGIPQLGAVMTGSVPNLGRMEASYRAEPAYMKGMVDYCAKQSDVTPQEYVDGLLSQSDGYYARNLGFIPGAGIRTAMRSLLTQAGEMRFSAYPTTDISAQRLAAYSPQDLISLLGVQMSVNGQNVSDMSFTIPENLSAFADAETGVISDEVDGEEQRERLKPRRFIKTEVSALKEYLGKDVRLVMKDDGRVKQGMLDRITDGVASVQQSVYGGKFTSHIPLDSIARAEVWRRD